MQIFIFIFLNLHDFTFVNSTDRFANVYNIAISFQMKQIGNNTYSLSKSYNIIDYQLYILYIIEKIGYLYYISTKKH